MRRMSALEFAGWAELYRLEYQEEEARQARSGGAR
jgi:hypothetical protein